MASSRCRQTAISGGQRVKLPFGIWENRKNQSSPVTSKSDLLKSGFLKSIIYAPHILISLYLLELIARFDLRLPKKRRFDLSILSIHYQALIHQ